jgi:hypothetical protein
MITRPLTPSRRRQQPAARRTKTPGKPVRTLLAATIVCALLSMHSIAGAQTYPPCNTPDIPNCRMYQDRAFGTSNSTGAVTIAVIFYGAEFEYGSWDEYTSLAVERLLLALADSNYEVPLTTYTNINLSQLGFANVIDDTYSQGTTLASNGAIQAIVENAIKKGWLSLDPNAIYVVVPDSSVTLSIPGFCPTDEPKPSGGCACGDNGAIPSFEGTTLKYAVVANSNMTPGCRYGFQTPNDVNGTDTVGAVDYELGSITHEVNEAITQGWTMNQGDINQYNLGVNTQMADFCEGTVQDTYYVTSASGASTTASANVHGYNSDFLLEPLRINGGGGAFGYCVTGYGGVFWGQDFGTHWSPLASDWSPNNYKGECENGIPVVGVSTFASGIGQPHAVMCSDPQGDSSYSMFQQSTSCHTVNYAYQDGDTHGSVQYGTSQQADGAWFSNGDWDPNNYKAECGTNEFMAGISQQTNGKAAGILCCPGGVGHYSCETQPFNSSVYDQPDYDWDDGYYKAECPYGRYAGGISVNTSTLTPHELLCCF